MPIDGAVDGGGSAPRPTPKKIGFDVGRPEFPIVLGAIVAEGTVMTRAKVVSQVEWDEAHRAHLAREKAFLRERDALAAARRALPWVKVEKAYTFQTPEGPAGLGDLFKARI